MARRQMPRENRSYSELQAAPGELRVQAQRGSDFGCLFPQHGEDALEGLVFSGVHRRGPQGKPHVAARRPSRRLRTGPGRPGSCRAGFAAVVGVAGCLPVGAVRLTAQFVDRPFDHLPQFRGNGHPHLGHVDVERRVKVGVKVQRGPRRV